LNNYVNNVYCQKDNAYESEKPRNWKRKELCIRQSNPDVALFSQFAEGKKRGNLSIADALKQRTGAQAMLINQPLSLWWQLITWEY